MTDLLFYVRPDGSYAGQFDTPHDGCTAIMIQPPDVSHVWNGSAWVAKPATLDELRAAKVAEVTAKADALISAGYPYNGLHVDLDESSRLAMTALASTAIAAAAGGISWPESYAAGWITKENIRVPLATPALGLTLAAAVGNYYASIIQRRRDLKDAALSAEDATALDAIDASAGWPA